MGLKNLITSNLTRVNYCGHSFIMNKDIVTFLRCCELRWSSPFIPDGQCAASLEDILIFATGIDVVPAMSFDPPPSLSFFVPLDPSFAFPQSKAEINHLVLPVLSSYEVFKKHLEYAVCQVSVMQGMWTNSPLNIYGSESKCTAFRKLL